MKKFLPFLSVAVLMTQNVALACPPGPGGHGGPKKLIEELDTNKDGQLSKDEVKDDPFLSDKFDEIDTNKDSQLSAAELEAHHKAHRPPRPPQDSQSDSQSSNAAE